MTRGPMWHYFKGLRADAENEDAKVKLVANRMVANHFMRAYQNMMKEEQKLDSQPYMIASAFVFIIAFFTWWLVDQQVGEEHKKSAAKNAANLFEQNIMSLYERDTQ